MREHIYDRLPLGPVLERERVRKLGFFLPLRTIRKRRLRLFNLSNSMPFRSILERERVREFRRGKLLHGESILERHFLRELDNYHLPFWAVLEWDELC